MISQIKKYLRKSENKSRHFYKRSEGDRVSILKKNNPKQFICEICENRFYEHFKSIASCNLHADNINGSEGNEGTVFSKI